jgi:hypothetical protein
MMARPVRDERDGRLPGSFRSAQVSASLLVRHRQQASVTSH